MLPLNDTEPNRYTRFPFMVLTIILINVVVFIVEMYYLATDPITLEWIVDFYGLTPAMIVNRQGAGALSAVTHMFLHGGVLHIFGNMLVLWVFGRRVEDACGPIRFLLFYLVCGLIAGICSVAINAGSDIPAIGASGAVFGIEGAYLMLYPSGRIRVLIVWIVPLWPRIWAIWIVLYNIIYTQLGPAIDVLVNGTHYGVGYWAHLGGFFGSLAVIFFLRPTASVRFWKSLPI